MHKFLVILFLTNLYARMNVYKVIVTILGRTDRRVARFTFNYIYFLTIFLVLWRGDLVYLDECPWDSY